MHKKNDLRKAQKGKKKKELEERNILVTKRIWFKKRLLTGWRVGTDSSSARKIAASLNLTLLLEITIDSIVAVIDQR